MSKDKIDLKGLINSLSIGIVVVDKYCNITFFNKETLNILGLNNESRINENILDILHDLKIEDFIEKGKEYEAHTMSHDSIDIIVEKKLIINKHSIEGAYICSN